MCTSCILEHHTTYMNESSDKNDQMIFEFLTFFLKKIKYIVTYLVLEYVVVVSWSASNNSAASVPMTTCSIIWLGEN